MGRRCSSPSARGRRPSEGSHAAASPPAAAPPPARSDSAASRVGVASFLERCADPGFHQISWLLAEAAANAVKHGQLTRLDCHVDFADGTIELRIRDDGHGFYERRDASELKSKWLGPRSLKDRVAEMGGKLAVRSDEGGTELSISMTLNENTR